MGEVGKEGVLAVESFRKPLLDEGSGYLWLQAGYKWTSIPFISLMVSFSSGFLCFWRLEWLELLVFFFFNVPGRGSSCVGSE
jgi:hypothetical protein